MMLSLALFNDGKFEIPKAALNDAAADVVVITT